MRGPVRLTAVRLRGKEAAQRRALNQERLEVILETFRVLDIDPVVVSSNDRSEILATLLVWSDLRRTRRVVGA